MLSGCCVGKLSLCISIHHAQSFVKIVAHLGSCLSFDTGSLLFLQPLPSFGLAVGHRTRMMSIDEKALPEASSDSAATEHLPMSCVLAQSSCVLLPCGLVRECDFKHCEQIIRSRVHGRAAPVLPSDIPVTVFAM